MNGKKRIGLVPFKDDLHPRPVLRHLGFEFFNIADFGHRQADIVETFEQTFLFERIQLKADLAAIRTFDDLLLQINGQGGVGPREASSISLA